MITMRITADLTQKTLNLGILICILCIPVWMRLPSAPRPFSANYITGFLVFYPMLFVIIWWLAFTKGRFNLFKFPSVYWLAAWVGLGGWTWLSTLWAFVGERRPQVGPATALSITFALIFAIALAHSQISLRRLCMMLMFSAVVHGIIGGAQVALQQDIGLSFLGEFSLDPQRPGVGVIQSGETRWLRPYGLAAHPNIFAGYIAVGLLSCGGFILQTKHHRLRCVASIAAAFLLWILLLTFSRGAWLGVGIGAIFIFGLTVRQYTQSTRRYLMGFCGVCVLTGILFFVMYRPLILTRTGASTEQTETRSITDRRILNDVALVIIRERPLWGVGAGNMAWYASHYFARVTGIDRRGENVHNIYLLMQSELGVIGFMFFCAGVFMPIWFSLRQEDFTSEHAVILCGALCLLTIGIFDHYPITLLHFQALLWGLLGIASIKRECEYNHCKVSVRAN